MSLSIDSDTTFAGFWGYFFESGLGVRSRAPHVKLSLPARSTSCHFLKKVQSLLRRLGCDESVVYALWRINYILSLNFVSIFGQGANQ